MPAHPISPELAAEAYQAVERLGCVSAAARELGLPRGTFQNRVKRHMQYEGITADPRRGFSPEHGMIDRLPDGFLLKGKSSLVNKRTGEVALEWVKTTRDQDAQERLIKAALDALTAEITPLPPSDRPVVTQIDLATQYTITDYHCGMLAWGKEAGSDWNLEIAEETLTRCYQYMIETAPASELGIVCQLGDFLHYDGLVAQTPTSGHALDADSRFEKMVQVAIRLVRRVTEMTLAKHDRVHVLMAEGNHDLASSVWLRQMLKALFEDEPRVTVETSPNPYYALEFGKVMLAYHHGHLRKRDSLTGQFAAQFPEIWGRTKFRVAHCGHYHHTVERENDGMTVFQHRTLAAKDAYAARGGYHAERKTEAITYHREFGEVGRIHVSPEMVGL